MCVISSERPLRIFTDASWHSPDVLCMVDPFLAPGRPRSHKFVKHSRLSIVNPRSISQLHLRTLFNFVAELCSRLDLGGL